MFLFIYSPRTSYLLQLVNHLQGSTCIPQFSTWLLLPYSVLLIFYFLFSSHTSGGTPTVPNFLFFSSLLFWLPFTLGGTWRTIHCRLCINCYGTGYCVCVWGGWCHPLPFPLAVSVTFMQRRQCFVLQTPPCPVPSQSCIVYVDLPWECLTNMFVPQFTQDLCRTCI